MTLAEIKNRDVIDTAPVEADPWLAMIERAARDPAIQVEKMERLFDLSERAQSTRSRAAFAADLALMQPKLPSIDRKGAIVVPADGKRAERNTPYARLEDIMEAIKAPLAEHGFAVTFRVASAPDGKILVTGILMHRDGHSVETSFPLPHDSSGAKNSVQAIGSSITYGRRYTLLSLLNITSHAPMDADDDAKKAGQGETIDAEQVAFIEQLIRDTETDEEKFLEWAASAAITQMTLPQYKKAVAFLAKKKERMS